MSHEKWIITSSELSLYLSSPAHTCFLPEPEPCPNPRTSTSMKFRNSNPSAIWETCNSFPLLGPRRPSSPDELLNSGRRTMRSNLLMPVSGLVLCCGGGIEDVVDADGSILPNLLSYITLTLLSSNPQKLSDSHFAFIYYHRTACIDKISTSSQRSTAANIANPLFSPFQPTDIRVYNPTPAVYSPFLISKRCSFCGPIPSVVR